MFKNHRGLLAFFAVCVFAVFGSAEYGRCAGKTYYLKIAHTSPPTLEDKLEYSNNEFKKFVEEKSKGRITVKTFPAGQLGGEREILEGIQMGSIEMGSISNGPYPSIYKNIMVFDLPYLFATYEIAYKVLDGPVGQEILADLNKKTGLKVLLFGENGYRNFTNSVRPIRKPADVMGLKIRTMENPAHMAMVRTLGGNPIPMPYPEVYSALAQKALDGQENPVGTIMSSKFQEVQKYMSLDGHLYSPILFTMNGKLYASMDAEDKKIIDEGAKVWQKACRDFQRKASADGVAVLKKAGMQVEELTPAEIKEFQKATRPVWDDFGKKNIDQQLIVKVVKAVAEAEKAIATEKTAKPAVKKSKK